MIWPFRPAKELLEGIESYTDIQRAYSEEQRIRLVEIPRRRLSHTYTLKARDFERARLMMRGLHPAPFDVPDWSNFPRAVTAVAGVTSLAFDNTWPEFTVDLDLIIWQDNETYELLSVSGSSSAGLTLATPLDNDYPSGQVLRLISCDAQSGFEGQHPAGPFRSAQVEWLCYDDSLATADSSSLSTYRGDFLLDDCPLVGSDPVPEAIHRVYQSVENGIARPFVDTALGQASETLGLFWQPTTRAEAWTLRRQLLALRGQQKAFWLPSFNNALELAATATSGAGSVTVREIGLATGYPSGALDFYMRLTSGTVITRQVTAVTPGTGTEVLTLSGTMPQTVVQADIAQFCLLQRMRLAQDRVEWLHRPGAWPKVVVAAQEAPVPS